MAELSKRVTANIAPDELLCLEQMASERRVSRSWLVREAILQLLSQREPQTTRQEAATSQPKK